MWCAYEISALHLSSDNLPGFITVGLFSIGVPMFAVGRILGDSVSTIAGTVAMILSTIGSALIILREKNKISRISVASKRQEMIAQRKRAELEIAGRIADTAIMKSEVNRLHSEIGRLVQEIKEYKYDIESLQNEVRRLNGIIQDGVPKKD